jgi:Carboxypeptidase regulatory-like domain/TonB dependent receptor
VNSLSAGVVKAYSKYDFNWEDAAMKTRFVYFLCAVFGLATAGASGQAVNATLLGTVTDSTGAVVGNAKVTIAEQNTGVSHSGQTNESGNYTFPDLPPGEYTVTAELTGFKTETHRNITLLVNSSTRVDLQLQPGNVTESVVVTAETPLLETDRADTGAKIEGVQAAAMPLGTQRNFQGLLNLVPGTTRATFDHSQFFNAASSLQTEVNGQLREGNNYQIEGIDDNERTGLLQVLIPPVEAIQTVDVSTSNFEAELGRAAGAVVNVFLKSGSNAFHGEGYEFLRNNYFQARNSFNPSVGHLAFNLFGGNIGGPIRRNKLFFFANYQKVFDHEANTNLVTVPSEAFHNGDLSASSTVIYDPNTGNPDGSGRQAFPGNQIPPTRINSVSAKLAELLPFPNQPFNAAAPVNNYFALLPYTKNTDFADGKVDYVLTDKDRLSGRFDFQRPVVYQAPIFGAAGGGPAQGAFEATGVQKTYSAGINYDHIFSPSLIAEFRAGFSHYHNNAQQSDYGTTAASDIGIPGANLDAFSSGLTSMYLTGWSAPVTTPPVPLIGYIGSLPWDRAEANIDFQNTWTKILGNHTIKWGADFRRIRDDLVQGQTFGPRGLYTFDVPQTSIPGAATSIANSWASFLLDLPTAAAVSGSSGSGRDLVTYFPAYRASQLFLFVQDKWVVTPKLTLDLGVRWEFYPPGTPHFAGGFSNYDPTTNSLVIAGVGGNPSDLGMVTRYKYFAPRTGFAYRLTNSTVIRTGFGISFTPFPDNNYAYNYPIKQVNQFIQPSTQFLPALLPNGQVATFQNGIPAPAPVSVPANGIFPLAGTPVANSALNYINLNFKNPYVESWNFSIQQILRKNFTLDVAYVGNHGVDTVAQPNINAGLVVGAGPLGQPEYPRTAATTEYFAGFSSMYNALQVKLNKRFSSGFLLTGAYTLGKGMTFQRSDDGGLDFYVDLPRNYARTDFDRHHTFVSGYIYELPFGSGKRWLASGLSSRILGGWQMAGDITLMSGLPVTLTTSAAGLNLPGATQTVNQIAPVVRPKGIGTGAFWFNPASFASPAPLTFGNTGINIFDGPGFFDLDFSVFKNLAINERFRLQLRAEAFNSTNTPQYGNPGTSMTSSTFGKVTGYCSGNCGPRDLQLGVKLLF